MAFVLRAFGARSFDTEQASASETTALSEAWVEHLLTGVPEDPEGEGTPVKGRRWRGLRHFVTRWREAEAKHVKGQGVRFREVIRECVGGFRRLTRLEQESGEELERLLTDLETAALRGSLQAVHALVPQAVGAIRSSTAARRAAVEAELQKLTVQLEAARKTLEQAEAAAARDALTRLYNRGTFDRALIEVRKATRSGNSALLMVDLDHFKEVNDTYGHPGGDEVLRQVADTLVRVFPRGTDLVARFGGEEFAVLLNGVDERNCQRMVTRLLEQVRGLVVRYDGREIRLTCSVGCALLRADEAPSALLVRADEALYRAKGAGRDRAVFAR